ncbi:MAG: anti-sigma F factor [Oscillospiraceae bacterium]|nr:anti-sigma F factor [Oscillospiraceae bacterium]
MYKENQFKIQFPSRSVNESFARMTIAAFCMQADPTIEQVNDIKTAVSEAVTNCVVHAYPDCVGTVYITARISDGLLTITVRDRGKGIENIKQAMTPMFTTDAANERAGLGFAVMQAFMDKVKVYSKPDKGTRVVMTKKLTEVK